MSASVVSSTSTQRSTLAERLRALGARSGWRRDLHRDAMLVIGLGIGLAFAAKGFAKPVDAVAYWEAGTSGDLYPELWAEVGQGYLFYPPPVAQFSALLQPIGWPVFIVLITVMNFGAMWFCARSWSLPMLALGLPWFAGFGPQEPATFLSYVLIGNLQWTLAAITIMALRHPSLWSIELLTKVTASIGWWWHVLRGEWRSAATGAMASVILFAVSFAFAPDLWIEFVGFVARNFTAVDPAIQNFPVPLGIRLATGAPLLVWGARTNRPWVVPVAVGWSLPALYGLGFLPFWVAGWRLAREPGTITVAPRARHA